MHQRFSIGRLLGGVSRMIAGQWLGLLVVTVVFGVLFWIADDLWARALEDAGARGDGVAVGKILAKRLLRTAGEALVTGALLQLALKGGDLSDPAARQAPFRAAIARFPAIFGALLICALPGLVYILLSAAVIGDGIDVTGDLTATAMLVGKLSLVSVVVGLLVYVFVGLAPAAAVAEDLGPRAALARSLALIKGRSLLIFGLYLAVAVTVVAILGALAMLAYTGRIEAPGPVVAVMAPLLGTMKVLALAALYLELRRLNAPDARAAAGEFVDAPSR